MSTPALYANTTDLRLVLNGTDTGTGTAAQLSENQLNLALQAATDRVTVYAGTVYDPATMPGIVHDLTLDLAAWWATTYYLKQKDMGPNHPVVLRYTEAVKVLDAIRKGEISLDVETATAASARIINRIPGVFTPADSDTVFDPASGFLFADTSPAGPYRGLGALGWMEQP